MQYVHLPHAMILLEMVRSGHGLESILRPMRAMKRIFAAGLLVIASKQMRHS